MPLIPALLPSCLCVFTVIVPTPGGSPLSSWVLWLPFSFLCLSVSCAFLDGSSSALWWGLPDAWLCTGWTESFSCRLTLMKTARLLGCSVPGWALNIPIMPGSAWWGHGIRWPGARGTVSRKPPRKELSPVIISFPLLLSREAGRWRMALIVSLSLLFLQEAVFPLDPQLRRSERKPEMQSKESGSRRPGKGKNLRSGTANGWDSGLAGIRVLIYGAPAPGVDWVTMSTRCKETPCVGLPAHEGAPLPGPEASLPRPRHPWLCVLLPDLRRRAVAVDLRFFVGDVRRNKANSVQLGCCSCSQQGPRSALRCAGRESVCFGINRCGLNGQGTRGFLRKARGQRTEDSSISKGPAQRNTQLGRSSASRLIVFAQ